MNAVIWLTVGGANGWLANMVSFSGAIILLVIVNLIRPIRAGNK